MDAGRVVSRASSSSSPAPATASARRRPGASSRRARVSPAIDLDAAGFAEGLGRPAADDRLLTMAGDCTDAAVLADFHAAATAIRPGRHPLQQCRPERARARRAVPCIAGGGLALRAWRSRCSRTMRLSRLVAPAMRERRAAASSTCRATPPLSAMPGLADYAAAKMGIVGFTRSLARELAPHRRHRQRGRARRHPHPRARQARRRRCIDRIKAGDAGRLRRRAGGRGRRASASSPARTRASSPARRC